MSSISVIIPNYNHAPYLPHRIESILAQTHGDFELLILDDCSADDSQEIIRRYAGDPRVRLMFNDQNSGNSYLQWRKGIEVTNGNYIWIAESDDFADETFLERLSAKLEEDSDIGLAFCETIVVDQYDNQLGWYPERLRSFGSYDNGHCELLSSEFIMNGREFVRRFMFPWNVIPNASAVLFRRLALEAIGGPVTSMRLCGDWLTYCKILSGWKVGHVPDQLNYFRQHSVNVRSTTLGHTVAREWLDVASWVEHEFGSFHHNTRRHLDRFAANALLGMERRTSDNRVPLSRMPTALARAATLQSRLLLPTVVALIRQVAGSLARIFAERNR